MGWVPRGARAAGCACDMDLELQPGWAGRGGGAASLRKVSLSGVPVFCQTQEDKSPFSAP